MKKTLHFFWLFTPFFISILSINGQQIGGCGMNFNTNFCPPGIGPCDARGGGILTHPCELPNNDLFIIKCYVRPITKSDGSGGQDLNFILENLDVLRTAFAPYNIFFSFHMFDPLKDDDIYEEDFNYYKDVNGFSSASVHHDDGLDIYFAPPGRIPTGLSLQTFGLGALGTGLVMPEKEKLECNLSLLKTKLIVHEMGHALGL